MQLSSRLQRIADYVRPGDRIIDVGTDHAYIPIWLLLNQTVSEAFATDIRSGPLDRARSDAAFYGVSDRLKLNQQDGLAESDPSSVDTIIIAGMGGETIAGILDRAPWAMEKRLILQPQTKQNELRDYLTAHHCAIIDAALVYDTGRIYLIWLVEKGENAPWQGVDAPLLTNRDPLLKAYLEEQIKRLRKHLHGLSLAAAPESAQIQALNAQLSMLQERYSEVQSWQQ